MRPETRILVGLALIGAGGAALVGMNIWTVRPWCSHPASQQIPEQRSSVPATASVSHVTVPRDAGQATHDSAVILSDAALADRATVDAKVVVNDASSADSGHDADGSVGGARDWSEIRFPEGSSVPTKQMISTIKVLSARLGKNFKMKVVLVGHGDDPKDPDAYIRLGRRRASAVLRMLVDYRVSMSRIAVDFPAVEHGRVVTGGVAPGVVQVRIEPRFLKKETDKHAP